MRLGDVPCDSMFVLARPEESTPIWHKGKDGKVRKVSGGWSEHRTIEPTEKEFWLFGSDVDVQPVHITPPVFFD